MKYDDVFPKPITDLPIADIPLAGVRGYLSQSKDHQIVFMQFSEDVELPAHSHNEQWGVVLEGRIKLMIAGKKHEFGRGDRYYIPANVPHSAKIFAGYADITFFNSPDRYGHR